jgi:hypothetical protein
MRARSFNDLEDVFPCKAEMDFNVGTENEEVDRSGDGGDSASVGIEK